MCNLSYIINLIIRYKLNRCYIKLSLVNILEMFFVFIEILFKMLLFKGGVLICRLLILKCLSKVCHQLSCTTTVSQTTVSTSEGSDCIYCVLSVRSEAQAIYHI